MFFKKRCSKKFSKIHRKTPVPEFLLKQETLGLVFSCEFYEIAEKTFFTEHIWATTSIEMKALVYFTGCGLQFLTNNAEKLYRRQLEPSFHTECNRNLISKEITFLKQYVIENGRRWNLKKNVLK